MPKATLTFNLPEDNVEYRITSKAGKMHSLIWEFTNFLRSKTKYAPDEESMKTNWEEVRTEWWRHLEEEGIDPYEE